jgi:hypothetical protein
MMDPQGPSGEGSQSQGELALWITGLLGQVGCVTAALIIAALLAGLWLDQQFATKPVFTLILLMGSVPVTIYFMIRIVLRGMARLQSSQTSNRDTPPAREEDGGANP